MFNSKAPGDPGAFVNILLIVSDRNAVCLDEEALED
jgi:hypothetical protein